jgi:hypothetical protein
LVRRVSPDVFAQFFPPEINVALRHAASLTSLMLVPKAPIHEYHLFATPKHDIWSAWQI